jgi:DegV family protein with EDD domain
MRQSVLDAIALAEDGKSGAEIKEYLEADALNAPIYLVVDTLKYLKKGGRVTPAAAAIGEVLNIKPVLQIDGGKLDAFAKVRGTKQALKTMLKALESEKDNRLKGKKCIINGAYSGDESVGEELEKILKEAFPEYEIDIYALPMSISTHVGPGTMGIGIYSSYRA